MVKIDDGASANVVPNTPDDRLEPPPRTDGEAAAEPRDVYQVRRAPADVAGDVAPSRTEGLAPRTSRGASVAQASQLSTAASSRERVLTALAQARSALLDPDVPPERAYSQLRDAAMLLRDFDRRNEDDEHPQLRHATWNVADAARHSRRPGAHWPVFAPRLREISARFIDEATTVLRLPRDEQTSVSNGFEYSMAQLGEGFWTGSFMGEDEHNALSRTGQAASDMILGLPADLRDIGKGVIDTTVGVFQGDDEATRDGLIDTALGTAGLLLPELGERALRRWAGSAEVASDAVRGARDARPPRSSPDVRAPRGEESTLALGSPRRERLVEVDGSGRVLVGEAATTAVTSSRVELETLFAPPFNNPTMITRVPLPVGAGRLLARPPTLGEIDRLAHTWARDGEAPSELVVTVFREANQSLTWKVYRGDINRVEFPSNELAIFHYHPRLPGDTDAVVGTPSLADLLTHQRQREGALREIVGDTEYRPGILWRDAQDQLRYTSYSVEPR